MSLSMSPPHNREKMSMGCPEPEPPHSLPCCGPGAAPGQGAGVPLLTEDMQALTLRTLAASDVTKHYELVRELGKGTYGKVDLVAYKGTGKYLRGSRVVRLGMGYDQALCAASKEVETEDQVEEDEAGVWGQRAQIGG